VAACEYRREDLLDYFFLSDNDLMKFLFHHLAMLAELLKNISQTSCFS